MQRSASFWNDRLPVYLIIGAFSVIIGFAVVLFGVFITGSELPYNALLVASFLGLGLPHLATGARLLSDKHLRYVIVSLAIHFINMGLGFLLAWLFPVMFSLTPVLVFLYWILGLSLWEIYFNLLHQRVRRYINS